MCGMFLVGAEGGGDSPTFAGSIRFPMEVRMNRMKAAAGLRICHLVGEDWIHPERISRGNSRQSSSGV